jgi:hypothetical protein
MVRASNAPKHKHKTGEATQNKNKDMLAQMDMKKNKPR